MIKEITQCEVCDNNNLIPVLNLGMHPICDDLLRIEDPMQNKFYPIEILFCNKCQTAHLKYPVPKEEIYQKDYTYRARFTKDVLDGMENLVDGIENQFGSVKGKKVVDIGCNDGSLLNFFLKKGATTYGVEPTDAYLEAQQNGHQVVNAFFNREVAKNHIKPDIITFTNVFAHIEDLNGLIDALKILMKDDTLLVIENHYLGAILEKNQFDSFYHAHPRTYSLNSFYYIANKLGRQVLSYSFPSRYGGNVRVAIGPKNRAPIQTHSREIIAKEEKFLHQFEKMNEMIVEWKDKKLKEIKDAIAKYGPIEAKAFPGRAAIPIIMLKLDETQIKCVYEKPGSLKVGCKVPGTKIPILSDDDMGDITKIPVLLNLAWHISTEIERYLRGKGFTGQLINII